MQMERGLRYFPVALFSSVMGVAGLAMSLRLIETIYHWNNILSNIIVIIATILFFVNVLFLCYRLIYFRNDVARDFNHPVRMNFFAAISISLLLLGTLYYDIH